MDFPARRTEMLRFLDAVYRYPHNGADLGLFTLPARIAFRPSSFEEAAQDAAQASSDEAVHVYLACCMLTAESAAKGMYHRGTRDDAAVIPGVWVDLDLAGPAHKGDALPPDQEAGLALLGAMAFEPSLVIDSGHGLYGWWLFDKPRELKDAAGRENAHRLVQGCQLSLGHLAAAKGWTVDGTADLARVLRPPGTINHKIEGDPRHVHILHESGKLYRPAELWEAWSAVAPEVKAPAPPLADRITTGNRTKSVESLAGTMHRRNIDREAIRAAAHVHNTRVCDPPLPDSKVDETVDGICGRYLPATSLVATNGAQKLTENGKGKISETWAEIVLLRDIKPEPIRFLYEPGILRNALTLIAADPGEGKGLVVSAVTAGITAGAPLPGKRCDSGAVLWVTFEEGWSYAIRPRLDIAEADPDRVYQMRIHRPKSTDSQLTADDLPLLRGLLERHSEIAMVVLDPLVSFIPSGANINLTSDVRAALKGLLLLAEEFGFGVVGIAHLNKAELTKILYRVANSIAFAALARSVLAIGRHDDRKVLAHIKANNTARFDPIPFTIHGQYHPGIAQSVGKVLWEDPDPSIDIYKIFDERSGGQQDKPSRTIECLDFLKGLLQDGPVWVGTARERMVRLGFGRRTVDDALLIAGVETLGRGRSARWTLPNSPGGCGSSEATLGEVDVTESALRATTPPGGTVETEEGDA